MTTARDVTDALAGHFLRQGYAFLTEVTLTDVVAMQAWDQLRDPTAPYDPSALLPAYRRIDVLLVRQHEVKGTAAAFERIAIEVKVSRSDFRRDTPEKRRAWQSTAHRFAYATPPGLVSRDEVPAECGLLEVDPAAVYHQRVKWAKRAPRRAGEPEPMGDRFLAYLAGRASRAERELHHLRRSV